MWSKKILSFQDQGTKNPAWKVDRITHTYFDTKTLMFSCSLIQRDNLCLSEMKSWDQESDIQFSDEKELCEKRITKTIHCPSTEFSACPVSDRNKFSKSTARSWRSNLLVIYIKCERQDLKTSGLCLCAQSLQSCMTLCDSMNSSLPGSSVHGILQARILHWVAIPSSRESSQSKDRTCVS